ncbi:copper resistance protein B [Parvibaculaceae bacterium PLY_AMNH_Bact1]|nr:copper resistance protein B [Parvibaculaceae bacterium PLY_AMNH_Bact1]
MDRLFKHVEADIDASNWGEADRLVTWDAEAWYGGDTHKVWLKSEGEWDDGKLENAEFQLLISQMLDAFWNAQAGIRFDAQPTSLVYGVVGVHGLAPQFIETDIALFLSEDGDAHLRLEGDLDIHLTQRMRLTPFVETDLFFQDIDERHRAQGLATLETGLQLAYEVKREIAPYIELNYETGLGGTRSLLRQDGEAEDALTLRAGLHFWFN